MPPLKEGWLLAIALAAISAVGAVFAGRWALLVKRAELRQSSPAEMRKADAAMISAEAEATQAKADVVARLTEAYERLLGKVEGLQRKVEDCEGHHSACREEVADLKAKRLQDLAARRRDRSVIRRMERQLLDLAAAKDPPPPAYTPGLVAGELKTPPRRK
jgi:hypothetical protein